MSKPNSPKKTLGEVLDSGEVSFTIESRVIRELGERLVKQPEVALLELIKNAYDADADICTVNHDYPRSITVEDDGHGMAQVEFLNGWMRIGTSSKEAQSTSRRFGRVISGEKGIGRFAVRYLGRKLDLKTVALDEERGFKTRLEASFDWPLFDRTADLGTVKVPYTVHRAAEDERTGTTLTIQALRSTTESIDFRSVQTASMGLVSPYKTLLRQTDEVEDLPEGPTDSKQDPGFQLILNSPAYNVESVDLASAILKKFVFRCVVGLDGGRIKIRLYRRDEKKPHIRINDRYDNTVGRLYADIRFFPSRGGTFTDLPVDGRLAKTWAKEHSGVAVFDRNFRVSPYGTTGDDWLSLAADNVKNERNPQSSLAKRHFPMDEATRKSTQLNYMLRLPYPDQLIGAVQVYGVRSQDQSKDDNGLIATADREGFIENKAFLELADIIRGSVELIAYADRELQQELDRNEQQRLSQALRKETRQAIKEIETHANLSRQEKNSIIKRLAATESLAVKHDDLEKRREIALEVMSLLGVVAGFMTHEFGTAINQLERSHSILQKLAKKESALKPEAEEIGKHIATLREFVTYSQGYIKGTSATPDKGYPVRPRIQQVIRVFGKYASDRHIDVSVDVENDVLAPQVPVSLYNGVVLNLFTNALKAITAKSGVNHRQIAFRAWNEKGFHYLEVSDTGIGIPSTLQDRIFDPLFTTTGSNRDPLGSGMGLGLTLVRRGAESFGGTVQLVKPPPGFSTCFRVRLPFQEK